MNILIVGYGNMGKEVEKALLSEGHTVAGRIDNSGLGDAEALDKKWLGKCEGVIEFALADGVVDNARLYAESGIPAVVGTTGWSDALPQVKKCIEDNNGTYLYGSNFSIGAHIFFKLAETASAFVNELSEYDMMLHEYHHNKKKDSPSGTALTTAKRVLKASSRKDSIITTALNRPIKDNELHVSSTRGGSIPGIHTFTLDSIADTVTIEHSARNRQGFALGAVKALAWLKDKKGLLTVDDFIADIIGGIL